MKNSEILYKRLAFAVIFFAILLRLIVFFQNRSLFIDEASLSAQVIDKSFAGLFGNFVDQFAPPLFCVLLKAATLIFGSTELALRFFPLAFGIGAILLFYHFCKHFLEIKHVIFPLFLFCFSVFMVQYATEAKQYTADTAIALGALLYCLKISPTSIKTKHFFQWGIFGILSIWFSMPVVFILFAVGVYYGFSFIQKQNWRLLLKLSLVIAFWLLSFGIYFFTIIKNDLGIEKLENYHAPFFMPLLPTTSADLIKIGNILLSFFRTATGSTTVAIGWGIISVLIGIYFIFKKDKFVVMLISLPVLMAIIASGLQYYSLIPRLTLFFIPIIVLFIGKGTQVLLDAAPKYAKWLIIFIMTIVVVNQKSYPYFFQRFEIEELRQVLNYVNENSKPEELKYVHFQAENAYVFYSQFYKYKENCSFENAIVGLWNDRVSQLIINRNETKIWVIFSHFDQKEIKKILAELKDHFEVIDSHEKTGASCYLLKRK